MMKGVKPMMETNKESVKQICESIQTKGENRPSRLVDSVKVLTLGKEMTLETNLKHIDIWTQTDS